MSVTDGDLVPTAISSALTPPPSGPYSSAVRVGSLLFVSGHAPFGPDGQRVGTDFSSQAHAVFDSINTLASQVGSSLANVVRLGAYISNLQYVPEWNEVCRQRLTQPYPARTTIPVVFPRFDVEIDAVVYIP